MEIVDAQLHPNRMGPDCGEASPNQLVDVTVAAMDAVGVRAALLDEWAGWTPDGRYLPGFDLPGGARRTTYEVCEAAVRRFPDRFGYVAHVEPDDPDLPELLATLREHPGRLGLRWLPSRGTGGVLRTAAGPVADQPALLSSYRRYFVLAQRHAIPVFLVVPGQAELLEPFVAEFADLWFIVDHCGVDAPLAARLDEHRFDALRPVLRLARYPNVALKWCHAPRLSTQDYPFRDVLDAFRTVLDAFGPKRIIWASDHTQGLRPGRAVRTFSWSDSLGYLRHSDVMSPDEAAWVFGGTVRAILRWSVKTEEDG